jgi:hypothetical protein
MVSDYVWMAVLVVVMICDGNWFLIVVVVGDGK